LGKMKSAMRKLAIPVSTKSSTGIERPDNPTHIVFNKMSLKSQGNG